VKEKLRIDALKNRDRIHNPQKGFLLRDNFLRNVEIPHGSIISAYWPIGSEIDVRPLITEIYNRGYDICLPLIEEKNAPLKFRHWEPEAVMVKSSNFKIFEPCKNHHDEMIPNIIIVPLLAFDKAKHRLGYGGGFYDRTIAALKPAMSIGVAYSDQEIDKIPSEDWDVQLNKIVTENKTF